MTLAKAVEALKNIRTGCHPQFVVNRIIDDALASLPEPMTTDAIDQLLYMKANLPLDKREMVISALKYAGVLLVME